MKQRVARMLFLCLGMLLAGCSSVPEENQNPELSVNENMTKEELSRAEEARREAYMKRKIKLLKADTQRVHFKGKVVDQFGNPVENCTVLYRMNEYRKEHKGQTTTDKDGMFVIKGRKAYKVEIQKLLKVGYDHTTARLKISDKSEYAGDDIHPEDPSSQEPKLFSVRKKDEGVPLYKNGKGVGDYYPRVYWKEGEWLVWDVVQNIMALKDSPEAKGLFPDFMFKAVTVPGTNDIELSVQANGEKSGIQEGHDSLVDKSTTLFECPEGGYGKTVDVRWENRVCPAEWKHFFIRVRDKGMYGRLAVRWLRIEDKRVFLEAGLFINTFGTRSLENVEPEQKEYYTDLRYRYKGLYLQEEAEWRKRVKESFLTQTFTERVNKEKGIDLDRDLLKGVFFW